MNRAPANRHARWNAPLGRWLVLSVALHMTILIVWHSSPLLKGQRETVLSVMLAPGMSVPPPATRLAEAATSNAVSRAVPPRPATIQEVAASRDKTEVNPVLHQPTRAAAATEGPGQTLAPSAAQIRSRLLSDLARHFEYPLLARLRGWEGTVLIGLDIEADGLLHHVYLARSSGYDVLDQSAIKAVQRVARLQETSNWLNGKRLHMQLPVIYRLVER